MKRREFVRTGTQAALVTAASSVRSSRHHTITRGMRGERALRGPDALITLRDPRVKALALRAIDAAKSAGAHYADVRLTNTIKRHVSAYAPVTAGAVSQEVELGVSIRALVNGYWGWAATPIVSIDEAVRIARLSVQFATLTASRSRPNTIELAAAPVIHDSEWMTPVNIDPFELDGMEMHDWLYGLGHHVGDLAAARGAPTSIAWTIRGSNPSWRVNFQKQERVFASTDGTLLTQTIITTEPVFEVSYRNVPGGLKIPHFNMPVQAGWERIVGTPIVELFQREMDRVDALPPLPPDKIFEIGRYDVVFGVDAVMQLISQTFGRAAQVDRALGYWANSDGTSYLGPDPLSVLGTPIASPLVTVTAERSHPMGLATVKWDDEGVVPEDVTLVKDGVFVDYQTTREQAPWLAPWYAKQGRPVRSHGHAASPSALEEPIQHAPNLVLHPGSGTATEASMVQDLEYGLYIPMLNEIEMDWQALNGFLILRTGGKSPLDVIPWEIKRGKPIAINGGIRALVFNTRELWKNVEMLGGASSTVYSQLNALVSKKGDPIQQVQHSVGAVPMRVKQLALIDPGRRA